jgi:hypothetical protein
MNFQFPLLVDQPSLWITPIVVMAFLLLASRGRDGLAGFLCGLPHTSATLMYVIAQQHGDLGAVVAARSAIVTQCAFIVIAALIVLTFTQTPKRSTVAREPRRKISSANIAFTGGFVLTVCAASISLGAQVGGFMAGIPFGTLCMFASLCVYRGRSAARDCARGYVVGQAFTIAFMTTLVFATPEMGFRDAFLASLTVLAGLIAIKGGIGAYVGRGDAVSSPHNAIVALVAVHRKLD